MVRNGEVRYSNHSGMYGLQTVFLRQRKRQWERSKEKGGMTPALSEKIGYGGA